MSDSSTNQDVIYTTSNVLRFEVDGWHDVCKAGLIHKYVIKVCQMLVEGAIGAMKLFEDHKEENCVMKSKTFYASRAVAHDHVHYGHSQCPVYGDSAATIKFHENCVHSGTSATCMLPRNGQMGSIMPVGAESTVHIAHQLNRFSFDVNFENSIRSW